MNWLKTKIFCFFVKKEELSDEFSSSHVADSSSTFAYLDYIMNFLKVNVRDLALAKYEDTYLLRTTKFLILLVLTFSKKIKKPYYKK